MLAAGCLQVCAFGGWSFLSTLIVGMQEFFGTSCWLLAASRDAGWSLAVAAWWKFLLAAGIVVPARWIFLVQELISVIPWILLEC